MPANRTQLAPWEYVGLMLTYWCNARCSFCYVYSSPHRGGEMSIPDAVRLWESLDEHARDQRVHTKIHLAGGEPFGDWPRLLGTIRAARDAGLSMLEKVETNCYWATTDAIATTRLEQLDALGIEKLLVSCDVYHQEFIPIERVRRVVEAARRVFGRGRVTVRWWDYFNNPVDPRKVSKPERRRLFHLALKHHPERLVGRAADQLADLFPRYPAEHFAHDACPGPILRSKHVHVDGYGNVFPGVCAGIKLGNAFETPPHQLWHTVNRTWTTNPALAALVRGGSHALYQIARTHGYAARRDGYANKCHLCHDVRQFFFERGLFPDTFGPAECYADAQEKRDAARVRALPVVGAPAHSRDVPTPGLPAGRYGAEKTVARGELARAEQIARAGAANKARRRAAGAHPPRDSQSRPPRSRPD